MLGFIKQTSLSSGSPTPKSDPNVSVAPHTHGRSQPARIAPRACSALGGPRDQSTGRWLNPKETHKIGWRPTQVGWRPWQVGWRPSLLETKKKDKEEFTVNDALSPGALEKFSFGAHKLFIGSLYQGSTVNPKTRWRSRACSKARSAPYARQQTPTLIP